MSQKTKECCIKMLIVIGIALLIEVIVFNCRFWQSRFFDEISAKELGIQYMGATDYGEGYYVLDEEKFMLGIEGIDADIKNIYLDISLTSSVELPFMETGVMDVLICAEDEACSVYYEVMSHSMHTDVAKSKYIWLDPYGDVQGLYMEITPSNTGTILLKDIVINAKQPFEFHSLRFLCILVCTTFVFLLRKESFFWKENCEDVTLQQKITLAAMLFLFGAGLWFFVSGNSAQISIFGSDFNPYQELSQAMAAGQVSLLEQPSSELMSMENPYDYLAREDNGVEYKWDTAYYDGNYYVYFGVVPCLLFYLPIYVLTGLHMPDVLVLFFGSLFFAVGCYFLLKELLIRYYPKTSFGLLCVMTTVMTLGCQIPFFIIQPDPYNIPILIGMVFTVWGMYFWLSSRKKEGKGLHYGRLFLGSLCMALVLGCRPQMILFSALAFPLFWEYLKTEEGFGKKERTKGLVGIFSPYFLVGIPLAIYNYIRFDSFFEFGAKYNLTVFNMTETQFSLEKLIFALYENLLRLPNIKAAFPFVEMLEKETTFWQRSHMFIEKTYGGLLVCNLVLFVGLLFFAIKKEMKEKKIYAMGVTLLSISFVILCVDVVLAGISYRYLGDYSFALFMVSFMVIAFFWQQLKGHKREGLFKKIILGLFICSLLFNIMIFFSTSNKYPLVVGNTSLYYEIISSVNVW